MTQDEIIEMARQAGANVYNGGPHFSWKELEAFAKLVAAKARKATLEEMIYEHPTTAIEKAVTYEREACAKVCDELAELNRFSETDSMWEWGECAAAIRARGNV